MPSRFVRTQWWPPVPLACLAYLIVRSVMAGLSTFRLVGIVVCALWSALALYDRQSGGKLLRWLYPDTDDGTGN